MRDKKTHLMEAISELIKQKEDIENNLKLLWEILNNNNVGMDDPLTDSEDFPRSDINVYEVRHARHQIRCLRNDHTSIMKQIEEGIIKLHSEAQSLDDDNGRTNIRSNFSHLEPFAIVDMVNSGSPADIAGIQVNDEIAKFGSVIATNFKNMSNIAEVVHHSVNSPIEVTVYRSGECRQLTIIPKMWSGRGLLGCNIVILDKPER